MLSLNIGFNRKVGEANYSSRGASVNLEIELDSVLIDDPDRLKVRIRQLFDLAKAAVDEELNRGTASTGNGHTANGNGSPCLNVRRATASQIRALHAIANRCGIQLADTLWTRFEIRNAESLSITEASELIDELNSLTNGIGDQ